MNAHTIPNNHHGIFDVTFNTLVFLMIQWQATRPIVINEILITAIVPNKAVAPSELPNIDPSNLQAVGKSGDLKNTQVTFTRKNVKSASVKLDEVTVFKNLGAE